MRNRRRLLGLTIAPLFLALPAAGAGAPADVTVAAGYAGYFVPGRSVPVSASVKAERLLQGVLEVTIRPQAGPEQAASRARVPVEIAGGTTKSFLVVAPPTPTFGGPGGATVSVRVLDRSGDVVAVGERQTLRSAAGDELVGLLPGGLERSAPPAAAPLVVDAGVARYVELDRAVLAQAPASLEALGTIAAAPGDLASMAPPVRQALLRWLGDGGNLLVDAAPGSSVDGLPPDWQPGPEGHGPAGMGRVRLTGGAMAGGRWDRLVEPTTTGSGNEAAGRFAGFFGPVGSIDDALAADAGVRVPDIGGLLGFLLVYILVVGPVTAFVLRRRRRSELAWVVIPVIAVVFTAASYIGAEELRAGTKLAHGTALQFDALGARATTYVGIAARSRRTSEVSFPGAWSTRANPSSVFNGFTGGAPTSVDVTRRGPTARLELGSGQFGVASGAGPVRSEGGLELTATSDGDGRAEGTIRNRMPYPLFETGVLIGSAGVSVGRLEPDEQRSWSVVVADGNGRNAPPAEFSLWAGAFGRPGPAPDDSVVNFPVWQAVAGSGSAPRSHGVAVAVGWTRQHRPEVVLNGVRRTPVGRTAVIAEAPVRPVARLTDVTMRGDIVRGAGLDLVGGGQDIGVPRMVVRWALPAGRTPSGDLVASIPAPPGANEVWVDGRWQPLAPVGQPGPEPAPQRVVRGAPFGTAAPAPVGAPTTAMVGPGPVPAPSPIVVGGPGFMGASTDFVVPQAALRDGLVFVRMPFFGGPQPVSATLREPAR
ncbi:MAG: hypothetical protein ACR2MO_17845 [Acidimicrobiales bacterium]